jgi:hypothetical protein
MIVITVELWPRGDSAKKKRIAKMVIINDGSGTETKGNYSCQIHTQRTSKHGRIENFPRKRQNVWILIGKCLKNILGDKIK